MSRENRVKLLKDVEKKLSSNVITYITGDRAPFNTQIAPDVIVIIKKHLDRISNRKGKICLFLYSCGGDMVTPLRLVRLVRQYCDSFELLVPYRALSAATLVCLGADKIYLGKLAEMSPVDPQTGHPHNPIDPSDPNKIRRVPISVEDVTSYFLLARERAFIRDEQMVNIFHELADKIHPLAIGNVYRGYRMIRLLARKLLSLHMDEDKDKRRIEEIISKLTEELCIHGYLISREEAKDELGLKVEYPDDDLEKLMWSLYEDYAEEMQLWRPFDPIKFLNGDKSKTFSISGAFVESISREDRFIFTGAVEAIQGPKGELGASVNMISPPHWMERPKEE